MTVTEEEYYDWLNSRCFAQYVSGGFDPYATDCELEAGHSGPHVGADPFGNDGKVKWEGGGSCAGDPLPVRNVEWVAA